MRAPLSAALALSALLAVQAAAQNASDTSVDARVDEVGRSPVTLRLTGGIGFGSRGLTAGTGGQLGVRRWIVAVRHVKAVSGGGHAFDQNNDASWSEHNSLLVGRALGARERSSILVGAVQSKTWLEQYRYCGLFCGATTKKIISADGAVGAGFIARTHTGPLLGVLALNVELAVHAGPVADGTLTFGIDLGKLR